MTEVRQTRAPRSTGPRSTGRKTVGLWLYDGRLSRRILLSLTAAVGLTGLFGLYRTGIGSLTRAPRIGRQSLAGQPRVIPAGSPQNVTMAERYLARQPWAANAKYQIRRGEESYLYFEEWEPVEDDQAVRFRPFAMVWMQKGRKANEDPITITCDSAYVKFASKFDMTNPDPGRIIRGALQGNVLIQGPNGLVVRGHSFVYSDSAMHIVSDDARVEFAYDRHRGRAWGLTVDLIRSTDDPRGQTIAVEGIKSVQLRRKVAMNLLFEGNAQPGRKPNKPGVVKRSPDSVAGRSPDPVVKRSPDRPSVVGRSPTSVVGRSPDRPTRSTEGLKPRPSSGKKREPVHVKVFSAGRFDFVVDTNIATFHDTVRVYRPTAPKQYDSLQCDLLTLVFEPDQAKPKTAPPSSKTADINPVDKPSEVKGKPRSGLGSGLTFRRLLAEGDLVTLVSETNNVTAYMTNLVYDAKTHVVALTDGENVEVRQQGSIIRSPEITLLHDDDGQIQSVLCRGAGSLERRDPQTHKLEFGAKWIKELRKYPDPRSPFDVIQLEGEAIVRQPLRQSGLAAEFIKLWIDRQRPGDGNEKQATGSSGRIRPRQLVALRNVAMMSPQMQAETERLDVWFIDRPQSSAARSQSTGAKTADTVTPRPDTTARSSKSPVNTPNNFAPNKREDRGSDERQKPVTGQGSIQHTKPTRDISDNVASRSVASSNADRRRPGERSKPAERKEPIKIVADHIQARIFQGTADQDSQVDTIWTTGHVDVTQKRPSGKKPLHVTGQRLHLQNRGENDQILDVHGTPAHIDDSGMQIEGEKIHLDRIRNLAWVQGAGLLRLPVKQSPDGKPLGAPRMLDVWWKEQMTFDGGTARFFGDVRTVLDENHMHCQEMDVLMTRKLSFVETDQQRDVEVHRVTCRDDVRFERSEYEGNKLIALRRGNVAHFVLNQLTGKTEAQGPGRIISWRRGGTNRAGLSPNATSRANSPLKSNRTGWEYLRITFDGKTVGNTRQQFGTFYNNVHVLYGPVTRPLETIDPDALPPNGGWMRSHSLRFDQHVGKGKQPGHVTLLAKGNAELEGRSFHALADFITYDESKGLYTLRSTGKRNATIWRQKRAGDDPSEVHAQRMEFVPALNQLRLDRATGLDGIQ